MSDTNLQEQILELERRLREEKLFWSDKLRDKEKENFLLQQSHQQKQLELDEEITILKQNIVELKNNNAHELLLKSEEFGDKIKIKENRIGLLISEKEQLTSNLKKELEQSKTQQKEEKLRSRKKEADLKVELVELHKSYGELETLLDTSKKEYLNEIKLLESRFTKENALISEEFTSKIHDLEDEILELHQRLSASTIELQEKETYLHRQEKIRESETEALRSSSEKERLNLENRLQEAKRQRDHNLAELKKIKEDLNAQLSLNHQESELLHNQLLLREEDLNNEISSKNELIQHLNDEITNIKKHHADLLMQLKADWDLNLNSKISELSALRLEIERLTQQSAHVAELRELENTNWRDKVKKLEQEYQYELAQREVEYEESNAEFNLELNTYKEKLSVLEEKLQYHKTENVELTDDFKKRLADKQDEIDELVRDLENLKNEKDDLILRKEADFSRTELMLNSRLEDLKAKKEYEIQELNDLLDKTRVEKNSIELEKAKIIESLTEKVKARRDELEHLKKDSFEKEAEWRKQILAVQHEKAISDEEKKLKEEELKQIEHKLRQEVNDMAAQLEKRREHWEWLISQKQLEINKIQRESQEEIIYLKEEFSHKQQELEAQRSGLEQAVKELSDKMETDRAGKYIQLKEKDETIQRLQFEFKDEKNRLAEQYSGQIKIVAEQKIELERKLSELEIKLKTQREVWEEKLMLKERELESVRNQIKDREEELYVDWREKRKINNQKILELSQELEALQLKYKSETDSFESRIETVRKTAWEADLKSVKREKELELHFQSKIQDIQKEQAEYENEVKILREQLNTERIAAFRRLREREDELIDIRTKAEKSTEKAYNKYTEKAAELEELKAKIDILNSEKESKIASLKYELESLYRSKSQLETELTERETKWQHKIHQKQEDFDRFQNQSQADIKILNAKLTEAEQALKQRETLAKEELKALTDEFEKKEIQIIDDFKEKEKVLIVDKAELESQLNLTSQELSRAKLDLDVKESEVRRKISGDYESRIYQLKLDSALAKSELDWVREKLSSEKERWASDLQDSRKENASLRARYNEKIIELESEYTEKNKALEARRKQLDVEKDLYQDRIDAIRLSYQDKINAVYEEMSSVRSEYEQKISLIRAQTMESAVAFNNQQQSLQSKINALNLELENKNIDSDKQTDLIENLQTEIKKIQLEAVSNEQHAQGEVTNLKQELAFATNALNEKVNTFKFQAEEDKKSLNTKFAQIEFGLRQQLEDKRQQILNKENDIRRLKDELEIERTRFAAGLESENKHLQQLSDREIELKSVIDAMSVKLAQAEKIAMESELRAESMTINAEGVKRQAQEEVERLKRMHALEKSIYQEDKDRLRAEIKDIRTGSSGLGVVIENKQQQIEQLNSELKSLRSTSSETIQLKVVELNSLKEQMLKEKEIREKQIEEREQHLNQEFQRRLDEKENRWQGIYAAREKELLQYRTKLQEELEQHKRDRLNSDRIWDVRLKEKEDELKEIQLLKAQNESNLTVKLTRAIKELNILKSKYLNAQDLLKEKEASNRELRARMAQRDLHWKTAYRNKQVEVKRLTFELHQSRRGILSKIMDSMTGADKKSRQTMNKMIQPEVTDMEYLKR